MLLWKMGLPDKTIDGLESVEKATVVMMELSCIAFQVQETS